MDDMPISQVQKLKSQRSATWGHLPAQEPSSGRLDSFCFMSLIHCVGTEGRKGRRSASFLTLAEK